MTLFENESLDFSGYKKIKKRICSDSDINQKYITGEVRIITEQARYPLNSIVSMIDSDDYELNPEFQRRHRWDTQQKSRLIESFIMNVPVPPIFLYEDSYSHYQVMDGLQRLTAIYDFYIDKLILKGLQEWPELNGRKYSSLPEQIKRGVDRRYLSSIILLQETAKNEIEAERLKQLVFERINSGGVGLAYQESRNAIYDGPLHRLCIRLSRNKYLCKTWGIPEQTEDEINEDTVSDELLKNDTYRTMKDVEIVLRFFAHRQRHKHATSTLSRYFDLYLKFGNRFPIEVLTKLETLFLETIEIVSKTFGKQAFYLYRIRNNKWSWYKRPSIVVYDPLMCVFSRHLGESEKILGKRKTFRNKITSFYQKHYDIFKGRNVNQRALDERDDKFETFVQEIIGS